MGVRFRKSVKLGKYARVNVSKSGASLSLGPRGASVSIGKRGVYQNIGIPGTGLSYRSKISDAPQASGLFSKKHAATSNTANAVGIEMALSTSGELTFKYADSGESITDPDLISQIKKSPQFAAAKAQLKSEQAENINRLLEEQKDSTEAFTKVHRLSAKVDSTEEYALALDTLSLSLYTPESFSIPKPSTEDIEAELFEEAQQVVKAVFGKKAKQEQYVKENLSKRLASATEDWETQKSSFLESEAQKEQEYNSAARREYEDAKEYLTNALNPTCEFIENLALEWLQSVDYPLEMDMQLEYQENRKTLLVDLDLPEIEDLPTEYSEQLKSGNLKTKQKSQKQLREEYASSIFSLAIFVSSNLFAISPEIRELVVSGYSQRRNKTGDAVDEYLYSIKFARERFYGVNYDEIDPESFCMSFENRCNKSATHVFKAIAPFD